MGRDIPSAPEDPLEKVIGQEEIFDIASEHEQARLVMADLEDLFTNAVIRALAACFSKE